MLHGVAIYIIIRPCLLRWRRPSCNRQSQSASSCVRRPSLPSSTCRRWSTNGRQICWPSSDRCPTTLPLHTEPASREQPNNSHYGQGSYQWSQGCSCGAPDPGKQSPGEVQVRLHGQCAVLACQWTYAYPPACDLPGAEQVRKLQAELEKQSQAGAASRDRAKAALGKVAASLDRHNEKLQPCADGALESIQALLGRLKLVASTAATVHQLEAEM